MKANTTVAASTKVAAMTERRFSIPPPGPERSPAAGRSAQRAAAGGRVKRYGRPSRSKTLAKVAAASACAFVAIFGGLSMQMASGKDPALGPKAQALVALKSQRPHKRVIKRTVIVRKVYPVEQQQQSSSSVATGTGYSAPAASAPAYSAPAPAPAPAPVTTSTS